ncbi:unnamed protein product [Nyctereutes procyonoides]|uniref:(raccoon dog) hypothetical protein n=1 Tax=Nyctereutes procyonoides TaxID=34880 RepID=A0A811YSJ6_NYCPR|nr:unnamed protein product [Nyctereutes procyonoides]CAD7688137.1 unnamed protein product [Nyctereutes procyonoides]
MATLRAKPEAQAKVDVFCEDLPDLVKKNEKAEWKKQQMRENKDEQKKEEDEDKGPPCGPLNLVTTWLQLQIPQIEDGNNFGVALEGFHTHISKYFSKGANAVTKAVKQPHVESWDIGLMIMEIHNAYAVLYDIILKSFGKLKKPKGETKRTIY